MPVNTIPHDSHRLHASLLVLLALFATLVLLPSFGTIDMNIWSFWGENPWRHGLVEGYALNAHEHPPGLTAMLWTGYCIADWLGVQPYLGIKLTFLPFLFASSAVVWHWSRNLFVTLFCHGVLAYSAMALSYIDIFFAPFVLLAFYLLQRERPVMAMAAFSLACLMKYPPLMILPFVVLFLLARYRRPGDHCAAPLRTLLRVLLVPLLLLAITLLVFGMEPLLALQRAFRHSILSAQALNLNWIIARLLLVDGAVPMDTHGDYGAWLVGDWQIPVWVKILSRTLYGSFYLAALLLFAVRAKTLENLLLSALLGHFAYFMFTIGAHENHLYLSCLLAMCLYCIRASWLPLLVLVCAISSGNLFLFYGVDGYPVKLFGSSMVQVTGIVAYEEGYPFDIRLSAAVFNVSAFLLLWLAALQVLPAVAACPHPASNPDSARR